MRESIFGLAQLDMRSPALMHIAEDFSRAPLNTGVLRTKEYL